MPGGNPTGHEEDPQKRFAVRKVKVILLQELFTYHLLIKCKSSLVG